MPGAPEAPAAVPDGSTCVVLGAGSWGTALAIQLARVALPTLLWGRDAQHLAELIRDRRNTRYLPEASFPEQLRVQPDLRAALQSSRDIIVAVPSHALRGMLQEIAPHLLPNARVAWATKGFEVSTGLLPHQVAREVLGERVPTAVISGPTFAREVGAGLPTAMTIAASDPTFASELAQRFSGANFRAYTSLDITGVEVGGAIKNVMAIGAGISDGLGFGANTRIALIARGLVEMTREKKHSWVWQDWATWCSPAPTTNRAIVASASRSHPVKTSQPRRRPSDRLSKVCWPLALFVMWPNAPASRCQFASRSIGSCTKAWPRKMP
jgi:glycerol-3-phosphate dehydrogenase (NAD(P)+)